MASDLDPKTSAFTRAGMILYGTDTMTAAWGSAVAKNIGFLSYRPSCLINMTTNFARKSSDIQYEGTIERGWFYLDYGTWLMYYGIQGSSYLDPHILEVVTRFPELVLYGTSGEGTIVCPHGGSRNVGTYTGSFLWYQDRSGYLMWELACRIKEPISTYACQVSLFGVRNGEL
jgi:hypothetical protein